MNTETCPHCGSTYGVGEDYRCPHGPIGSVSMIDDTLPGGARWMHNLGPEPVWVETKTDYNRELGKRGLTQAEGRPHAAKDTSPWASRTRLKPGARDPFLSNAE